MKNLILFIILSNITHISYGQDIPNYKVEYEYQGFLVPEENLSTTLFLNENFSIFDYNRSKKHVRRGNISVDIAPKQYQNIYQFDNDSITEYRVFKNGMVMRADWKADYNWVITDEEDEIEGYMVKKAYANSIELDENDPQYNGRVYAWFTPEIPISSGPARYYGLPGLILKVKFERSRDTYIFKGIEEVAQAQKFPLYPNAFEVNKEDVMIYNTKKIKKLTKLYKANKRK